MDFKDDIKLLVRFLKESRSLIPLQMGLKKNVLQNPLDKDVYKFIDRNLSWAATTEGYDFWWILQMKWLYIYGLWKKMTSQEMPRGEHYYATDLIRYGEDSYIQNKYKDILSEVFDLDDGRMYMAEDEDNDDYDDE